MSHTSYTLSGLRANLYGLLFALPVFVFVCTPYILIWCDLKRGAPDCFVPVIHKNIALINIAIDTPWFFWVSLLLIMFLGIVLHELIHGAVMAFFAKNGWRSIEFGFKIKSFAAYTHCKQPLKPNAYRLSLIMPGILLGDIPTLMSWLTGNVLFLFVGVIFYCAAAGDIVMLWRSRNITDGMLQDHPEKIGFIHFES